MEGLGGREGGQCLGYLQAVDDMLRVKVCILQPLLECVNKQLHCVCTMGTCMSSPVSELKDPP